MSYTNLLGYMQVLLRSLSMPRHETDHLLSPLSRLLAAIVPDRSAHEEIQANLLPPSNSCALANDRADVTAALAEAHSTDRWTTRARPTFLYVMYLMILWALPMGLVAAFSPATAKAITSGISNYLSALPEPLYTFFGTGYLGYATLRQWGKVKGSDR